MWHGMNQRFAAAGVPLRLRGFWPCPQFVADPGAPADLVGRFFRAAYRHGVILYNVSYVNFSHADADIQEALERLQAAMGDL